ncbi:MAG: SGNH/GDSL hydrolase family protein [Isosphaeraceae bacterium]
MPWLRLRTTRPPRWTQRKLPFAERADGLDRRFRRAILLLTAGALAIILAGTPAGRFLAASARLKARDVAIRAIGGVTGRDQIEAEWRARRRFGIEETRARYERVYAKSDPDMRALLDDAGMDPDHALLRWGNYDWTLLLSPAVFEADDSGRSYRFRPNRRSAWLRGLTLEQGVQAMFLVPETPRLERLRREGLIQEVEGAGQSTNSWGCRGPEPDTEARWRGLVLGDSFMQGMMVGDDETPPVRLEEYLRERLVGPVSVLNTGHLGYSPEQYFFTLKEYADRFRPHFVVISLCSNDFGADDWSESLDWISRITDECRARQWPFLVVPAPEDPQVTGVLGSSHYQGRLSRSLRENSLEYLDPLPAFVEESIRLRLEIRRRGTANRRSPLFNVDKGDGHFSPEGSRLWAREVGRRLLDVMEYRRVIPGADRTDRSSSYRQPLQGDTR